MKRLLLLLAFLVGAAQAIAPDKLAIGTDPVIDQAGMLAPADAQRSTKNCARCTRRK